MQYPTLPKASASNAGAGTDITGKFDPEALERGAKAMKEISSHADSGKAFEVIKMQEQTKQKELQSEIERSKATSAQASAQRAGIEQEEKRKTISHQQEQERRSAQYRAQLDSELYQKKLEDQQQQNDHTLQRQHEQFLQHEEMRKQNDMEIEAARMRTLEAKAKFDRETAIMTAEAEAAGRTKQERENVDVRLRELRASKAEERQTKLESLNATFAGLGAGMKTLLEDKQKMTQLVTGITALALGIYAAKNGTRMASNLMERRLGRPPLVRETSKWSWNKAFGGYFGGASSNSKELLDKIILEEELAQRLEWTTNSLVNAKANGTPFRHILLHGPPGTGKTLFARTLARQSGLDYAVMTGGDIGPLGKDAVDEVNKLFKWAEGSKKGMILFIDEADAFLRRGRQSEGTMSENARNVLSSFLHHTGTETDKFCVVLATNVRDILDRAVLDRVDEQFEFPLPGNDERFRMIKFFMDQHIFATSGAKRKIEVDEDVNDDFFVEMARRTEAFSGRQVAKVVLSFQSAVYGSGTNRLTLGLARTVLDWKLETFNDDVDTKERNEALKLKESASSLGNY